MIYAFALGIIGLIYGILVGSEVFTVMALILILISVMGILKEKKTK